MDIPHLFIYQLMEFGLFPLFFGCYEYCCYEHLPSSLCVDVCFSFVFGKYQEVEWWLGCMHVAFYPIPFKNMLEAHLLSHPQITVLNFCCPAQLLLAATSINLRLTTMLVFLDGYQDQHRLQQYPLNISFPHILLQITSIPSTRGAIDPQSLVELQCHTTWEMGGRGAGRCSGLKRQIPLFLPRFSRFSWVNVSQFAACLWSVSRVLK